MLLVKNVNFSILGGRGRGRGGTPRGGGRGGMKIDFNSPGTGANKKVSFD